MLMNQYRKAVEKPCSPDDTIVLPTITRSLCHRIWLMATILNMVVAVLHKGPIAICQKIQNYHRMLTLNNPIVELNTVVVLRSCVQTMNLMQQVMILMTRNWLMCQLHPDCSMFNMGTWHEILQFHWCGFKEYHQTTVHL